MEARHYSLNSRSDFDPASLGNDLDGVAVFLEFHGSLNLATE